MTQPEHLLGEVEARQVIAPYEARIADVIRRAVEAYHHVRRKSPADIDRSARAGLIYNYIKQFALAEFHDDAPAVRVKTRRGMLVLVIDDQVAVRFKKFRNATLAISVGSTRQQHDIMAQQLVLDDVAPTWLVAGYLWDETETAVERCAVTCLVNGVNQYAFDLAAVEAAPVVAFSDADTDDDDDLVIRPAGTPAANAGRAAGEGAE